MRLRLSFPSGSPYRIGWFLVVVGRLAVAHPLRLRLELAPCRLRQQGFQVDHQIEVAVGAEIEHRGRLVGQNTQSLELAEELLMAIAQFLGLGRDSSSDRRFSLQPQKNAYGYRRGGESGQNPPSPEGTVHPASIRRPASGNGRHDVPREVIRSRLRFQFGKGFIDGADMLAIPGISAVGVFEISGESTNVQLDPSGGSFFTSASLSGVTIQGGFQSGLAVASGFFTVPGVGDFNAQFRLLVQQGAFVVPEPSTASLFALGIVGLAARKRSRPN